jgi:hypothetical protein
MPGGVRGNGGDPVTYSMTRHLFLSSHVTLFLFQPIRTPGQFLWRCIIISVKQKTFDYISIGFHVRFLLYKFKGIGDV